MATPYRGPDAPGARGAVAERMEGGPYAVVRRAQTRCKAIDVHELLKKEIYAQNQNNDTDYVLQQVTNIHSDVSNLSPSDISALVGFEDYAVYLDSLGKSSAGTTLSEGTLAYSITTLNNNVELRNVISMRITPFYFPRRTNPRAAPLVAPLFTPNAPDLFFYRRLYLQVLTLPSTQSVNGRGSTQFQWELQVDDLNSLAVLCTPLRDTFYLPRPLLSMSEIQFRFVVPSPTGMRPVSLFNDTYTVQMIPGSNPIRFFITTNQGLDILNTYIPPLPAPAVLPGPAPPAIVAPGVAIQMTGFQSTQAATSNAKVQDLVNNPGGLFITSIQYESVPFPLLPVTQQWTTFTIADIDGSPVIGTPAPNIMIVMQHRIAIPMYFTCVRDQITNHIAITHE